MLFVAGQHGLCLPCEPNLVRAYLNCGESILPDRHLKHVNVPSRTSAVHNRKLVGPVNAEEGTVHSTDLTSSAVS